MKIYKPIAMLLAFFVLSGCKKFLEEKPNQKLVVPTTIASMQTLLDNFNTLNHKENTVGVSASDDFTMTTANYNSLPQYTRNLFIWSARDTFSPDVSSPWTTLYLQVYYANVVLDGIDEVTDRQQNQAEWANVKGQALLLRARSYFSLVSIWSLPYDHSTAAADLGVPLRLDANFNTPSVRANVLTVYQQILKDLKDAAGLLPGHPVHVIRPSKPAAYTYLARTFMVMNQTDSCLKYTNLGLDLKSTLMDYNGTNGITPGAQYPFQRFNPEVIFETYMPYPAALQKGDIDQALYNSYHSNDLRKTMFHRSATAVGIFKGTYSGNTYIFNGPATDELHLMKAECLARLGLKDEAITALNTLLIKRFRTNTFVPYSAASAADALRLVLAERRKELIFRGMRWTDIRRLNKLGANITLIRQLNGTTYTLLPNELRYALAIPEDIITISGIPQNLR